MTPTYEQLDALQELVNIGIGQAASILHQMINSHINLQVPIVKVLTSTDDMKRELETRLGTIPASTIQVKFAGSLTGTAQLMFSTESAASLVSVLLNEPLDLPDLNALKVGTLSEVGNIVLNGVMGMLSNVMRHPLRYSIPAYVEQTVVTLTANRADQHPIALLAQTCFTSQQQMITGDIILVFKVESFNTLLNAIDLELMEL